MAMMVKLFLFAIVAFVVAEIAALIVVGEAIGFPQAIILMIATSFAGIAVLRHSGRIWVNRLQEAVSKKGIGGLEADGGAFLTVAAGILLLVPGFITDVAGLLLLVPPIRSWIGRHFQTVVRTKPAGQPGVVDLDQNEWNRVPDRQINDQRRPNDRP
jgi:UPF0716 protein FxsA